MHMKLLAATAMVGLLSTPCFAQNTAPNNPPPSRAANAQPQSAAGLWRASKLHGINVYNQDNQKIGDIDDVLMDKDGKAKWAVIGVGGFLGMGEHNVAVNFSDLKFSDQPAKGSNTTGSNTNRSVKNNYPDHAVFNATKDQLKAMPQFKYGQ
jgi:PRC-barrel domain protein